VRLKREIYDANTLSIIALSNNIGYTPYARHYLALRGTEIGSHTTDCSCTRAYDLAINRKSADR